MADTLYGLNEKSARQIAKAIRATKSIDALLLAANTRGLAQDQIIVGKLTSRSEDDPTLYAWSEVRRNGTAWETFEGGNAGTLTKRPAIDCRSIAVRSDMTNADVLLARGFRLMPSADDPPVDKPEPVFYVVSYVEQQGQYANMVKQQIADNQLGLDFIHAHSMTF